MSIYPDGVPVERYAVISEDGLYRYSLIRQWGNDWAGDVATFIMLNPSTADAENDDPTIRRCVGFARALGCNTIRVVNLYALRATSPADLWLSAEPTGGQKNDEELTEAALFASVTGFPLIAAWGANARPDRVAQVCALPCMEKNLTAFGITKSGSPKHPLYLPSSARPVRWSLL